MSEREIRKILQDVIEDIDAGRIRPVRRMPWRNVVGSAVVAATLGLAGTACEGRNVGTVDDAGNPDASAQVDGGGQLLYMAPQIDAGPMPEYAEPFLDGGIQPAYAEPWIDGGSQEDYAAPPVDGGGDFLYAAPEVDGGLAPDPDAANIPAYGVPFCPPELPDPDTPEEPA